jgi:hypothetical protein
MDKTNLSSSAVWFFLGGWQEYNQQHSMHAPEKDDMPVIYQYCIFSQK